MWSKAVPWKLMTTFPTIRDQLYAEERQRIEKRQKPPNPPPNGSMLPSININVGPTQPCQVSNSSYDRAETTVPVSPVDLDTFESIEVAVEEYTNWHLAKVSTENFKDNIRRARDVVLENCFDLAQLHNPKLGTEFLFKEGVKFGVADRFVNDTKKWLKQRKRKRSAGEDEDYAISN